MTTGWLGRLGSPVVVGGLAAPAALALAVGHWALEIPWHRLATSRAVVVFVVAAVLSLVAGALDAAVARRLGGVLFRIGILLVIAAGAVSAGSWFTASIRPGEGEPSAVWEDVEAGPLADPASVVVRYLGRSGSGATLEIAGEEVHAEPGEETAAAGHTLRLIQVAPAPMFEVIDRDGRVLEQGMVKIATEVGSRDYIRVGVLPHRFYLSPTGDGGSLDALHLKVMRGKVVVLDQELARGDVAAFEGLGFRYDEGTTWAEVRVERRPPVWPAALGLVLVVVGALARRRS